MNTLASFRAAVDQGADGVELDVRLSADGQVVVIHDDRVDATSDGGGAVAELDLASLRALDAGAWFGPAFAGERIPTLLEVFQALPPETVVNVELKSAEGLPRNERLALAGLTVDAVRCAGRAGSVVFSSFDPRLLRILARLAPEIPRGLLWEAGRPWWRALLSLGLDLQALHPQAAAVNAALVRRAHARGRAVNVWTVNDPALARRLAGLGVDALISNRPAEIRAALG